jgi:hypothetical protein
MTDAPTFENLDLACAKAGKDIATKPSKELEKLVTEALAVLEEQGVYALFLFLKTRNGKGTTEKLHDFLKKTPRQVPLLSGNADLFTSLQGMANDLDKLLLAHDLLRQCLVYARYHARLREESEVRT